jgi:hypothetical protein
LQKNLEHYTKDASGEVMGVMYLGGYDFEADRSYRAHSWTLAFHRHQMNFEVKWAVAEERTLKMSKN